MMDRVFRKAVAAISLICVLLIVISIMLLLFGYRPFILMTGSMEPDYPKNSLILIDTKYGISDLEEGDVIAYRNSSGYMIMHRILKKMHGDADAGNYSIRVELKGDANNTGQIIELDDSNTIGREALCIPGLGRLFRLLKPHICDDGRS